MNIAIQRCPTKASDAAHNLASIEGRTSPYPSVVHVTIEKYKQVVGSCVFTVSSISPRYLYINAYNSIQLHVAAISVNAPSTIDAPVRKALVTIHRHSTNENNVTGTAVNETSQSSPIGMQSAFSVARRRTLWAERGEGGNILTYSAFCLASGSEVTVKGAVVAEWLQAAVESQLVGPKGFLERGKEQPSEDAHWQKEGRSAGDPTAVVGRETATRNNAVQVRVMEQRLPPSVEDREEAELGAEMLGISSDRPQSFGSGVKQDVVDRSLVVMGDGADLLRHSEDDVEVRYGEEFGSSVLKPLGTRQRLALWTVTIAARVVADALVAAGIALLGVAAERCRATLLDRRHDAALRGR